MQVWRKAPPGWVSRFALDRWAKIGLTRRVLLVMNGLTAPLALLLPRIDGPTWVGFDIFFIPALIAGMTVTLLCADDVLVLFNTSITSALPPLWAALLL